MPENMDLPDTPDAEAKARLIVAMCHVAAHRSRPSVRLLDVIYGPRALPLRTLVAATMLGRKVTGSGKEAQYGRLRKMLLAAAGVAGSCTAEEDAAFERAAEALLAGNT